MYKHKFLVRRKSFVWSDLFTYYGDISQKLYIISTTVTHLHFQKDSWLRVPHSSQKRSMLQLLPVERTPALPAAMLFNKKTLKNNK